MIGRKASSLTLISIGRLSDVGDAGLRGIRLFLFFFSLFVCVWLCVRRVVRCPSVALLVASPFVGVVVFLDSLVGVVGGVVVFRFSVICSLSFFSDERRRDCNL